MPESHFQKFEHPRVLEGKNFDPYNSLVDLRFDVSQLMIVCRASYLCIFQQKFSSKGLTVEVNMHQDKK